MFRCWISVILLLKIKARCLVGTLVLFSKREVGIIHSMNLQKQEISREEEKKACFDDCMEMS
mgnify:CR=1 FL=1